MRDIVEDEWVFEGNADQGTDGGGKGGGGDLVHDNGRKKGFSRSQNGNHLDVRVVHVSGVSAFGNEVDDAGGGSRKGDFRFSVRIRRACCEDLVAVDVGRGLLSDCIG